LASDGDKATTPTGGSMTDHLKRYRSYIDELKQGRSSGISAAFGRATDLLPPEVMAIAAPPVDALEQLMSLQTRVLNDGFNAESLKATVEALVESCADELDDPVGSFVQTEGGLEEVLSVYIENGVRMFMLSDLSTIDERAYQRSLVVEKGDQNQVERQPSEAAFPQDVGQPASPVPQADNFRNPLFQEILSAEGLPLWQIFYSPEGVELVSMADGGVIKKAEGRSEYIFSRLSQNDGDIKFFILSGFVVDPTTGNLYVEANQGAYTAAFFNSGWTVHQYRTASGEETFFVTEPANPGRAPITMRVKKIEFDLESGAASYETMDGSAAITLTSRLLTSL